MKNWENKYSYNYGTSLFSIRLCWNQNLWPLNEFNKCDSLKHPNKCMQNYIYVLIYKTKKEKMLKILQINNKVHNQELYQFIILL